MIFSRKESMKPSEFVVQKYIEVLNYLRSQFPMFHLSNFFFRDVQYGIMAMFRERGVKVDYREAERSARAFVEKVEREKIFAPIDRQTWVVRYPGFRKAAVRMAAAKRTTPLPVAMEPAPGSTEAR
jgi:hypothetical protein